MEITSLLDNSGRLNEERREKCGENRKLTAGKEWKMTEIPMLFSSNTECFVRVRSAFLILLCDVTMSRIISIPFLGSWLVVGRHRQQWRGFIQFKVKLEVSVPLPLQPSDGRPLEFSDRGRGRRAH